MSDTKRDAYIPDCDCCKVQLPPLRNLQGIGSTYRMPERVYEDSKPEQSKEKPAEELPDLLKSFGNQRRTRTSYDSETTFYLNSYFFEYYSVSKKLTRIQRLELRDKTGLDLRKITYWFSNRKRRSQEQLEIYRDTINFSDGQLSNYRDFIFWRRSKNLPDRITVQEIETVKAAKKQAESGQ